MIDAASARKAQDLRHADDLQCARDRRSGPPTDRASPRKPLLCPFPNLPPIVGYAKTATIRTAHAHELDAKAQRTPAHCLLRLYR